MTIISKHAPKGAFVWVWLPGATVSVVAGRIERLAGDRYAFAYGQSYLARPDAVPIYTPELPLQRGTQEPPEGMQIASALRDGAPDAWGRRVIINRAMRRLSVGAEEVTLDELAFLLESGSDRIGGLDFQESATTYVPRASENASLEELLRAADMVQTGLLLTPELAEAMLHGTAIGGARPKALIEGGDRKYIAKFSASNDTYSVVEGEFVAMRLARLAGLCVADVRLESAGGKRVVLIERFDRQRVGEGWSRRMLVSALTILGLDEMLARYASYADLAEKVRLTFTDPLATLRELFERIVFNVLVGNTDDHARNHAAFWDGEMLTLTPAYDICPQPRTGGEASQSMKIHAEDRSSRLSTCVIAAPTFGLSYRQAIEVAERQMEVVRSSWTAICDEAELSAVDRAFFLGRQVLNPYAFDDLEGPTAVLRDLAREIRARA